MRTVSSTLPPCGLSLRGLSLRGLSLRGLSLRGLSLRGLSLRGLAGLIAGIALVTTSAFAQDPPTPPGGFGVTESLNRVVRYSDGYRTTVDLRWPNGGAPTSGWPGVLIVHGLGGQRGNPDIVDIARSLAERGDLALMYDVRGQGSTPTLNPNAPTSFNGQILTRDMADLHYLANRTLNVPFDPTRFAVTGISQGGRHSWWAAAYSGRALPQAGYTVNFPLVSAVAPWITPGDPVEVSVPEGKAFTAEYAARTIVRSPNLAPLIYNEQNQLVRSLLVSGNPTTLVQSTRTPVLSLLSWHDENNPIPVPVDFLNGLPPTTPTRLYLGTFGHGTPKNRIEVDVHVDLVRRWFDRFLKRRPNRIDREPFADVALMPADPADYDSVASRWAHRLETAWPPQHSRETLFLRNGGTLSATPAPGTESLGRVRHQVAAGYSMQKFFQNDLARPGLVARNITFDRARFETTPLPAGKEIAGRVRLAIDVLPTGPNFQLHAALFDVPPVGPATFVTAGTALERRQTTPTSPLRITVDLNDIAYRFAQGHRIRLSLENVAWHRPGSQSAIILTPYFSSVDLNLASTASGAARITLPVPADPRVDLTPAIQSLGVIAGGRAPLILDGGAERAGHGYVIAAGVTGIVPPRSLPPTVYLNFDAVTFTSLLLAGQSIFDDTTGLLNANGRATASLRIGPRELPLAAAGLRIHWAAATFDGPKGFTGVSAPVVVDLVP